MSERKTNHAPYIGYPRHVVSQMRRLVAVVRKAYVTHDVPVHLSYITAIDRDTLRVINRGSGTHFDVDIRHFTHDAVRNDYVLLDVARQVKIEEGVDAP